MNISTQVARTPLEQIHDELVPDLVATAGRISESSPSDEHRGGG